jgi:hypothetical protein
MIFSRATRAILRSAERDSSAIFGLVGVLIGGVPKRRRSRAFFPFALPAWLSVIQGSMNLRM